ncbi:HAD domain-containing protein [Glutamicibacter soli]|uniref:HAD domain-containing protein n=1 Tax=Glutamicibacter soli TaxID=453836 RepID=UPI003FD56B60
MTNYLFLDIDGVLNAWRAYTVPQHKQAWADFTRVDGKQWGEIISPRMIAGLNQLIHDYDVQVIWSSSWQRQAPTFGEKIGLQGAGLWPWLKLGRNDTFHKSTAIGEYLADVGRAGDRIIWAEDEYKPESLNPWMDEFGARAIVPSVWTGITPTMLIQMQHFYAGDSPGPALRMPDVEPEAPTAPPAPATRQAEPTHIAIPRIAGTN